MNLSKIIENEKRTNKVCDEEFFYEWVRTSRKFHSVWMGDSVLPFELSDWWVHWNYGCDDYRHDNLWRFWG